MTYPLLGRTKISSPEEVCGVLSSLQRIHSEAIECRGGPGYRLVWILDEYQRIESLPKRTRDEINTSLHSIFNCCPMGLTLLLSFSGQPNPGHMPTWLTPELASRIGRTKVMVLPPLQPKEALLFVREVLAQFRTSGRKCSTAYFPFSKDACEAIIKETSQSGELKPRDIMSAFNAVLQEADPLIESGKLSEISLSFAKKVLTDYVNVASEEDA